MSGGDDFEVDCVGGVGLDVTDADTVEVARLNERLIQVEAMMRHSRGLGNRHVLVTLESARRTLKQQLAGLRRDSAWLLAGALKVDANLATFDLYRTSADDDGAKHLAMALKFNACLTTLDRCHKLSGHRALAARRPFPPGIRFARPCQTRPPPARRMPAQAGLGR